MTLSQTPFRTLVNRYHIYEMIGEGECAKVYRAEHIATGEIVAIKIIKLNSHSQNSKDGLMCQVNILKDINHPNVIRLYEVLETKDEFFLVMEFASGGEMFEEIARRRPSLSRIKQWFSELVSVLEALHLDNHLRVAHRDLKLENILLDSQGRVKVADFGFSAAYPLPPHLHHPTAHPSSPYNPCLTTFCGSLHYTPPEMLMYSSTDFSSLTDFLKHRGTNTPYCPPAVDVWALGVVLFALAYGRLPFDAATPAKTFNLIRKGLVPKDLPPPVLGQEETDGLFVHVKSSVPVGVRLGGIPREKPGETIFGYKFLSSVDEMIERIPSPSKVHDVGNFKNQCAVFEECQNSNSLSVSSSLGLSLEEEDFVKRNNKDVSSGRITLMTIQQIQKVPTSSSFHRQTTQVATSKNPTFILPCVPSSARGDNRSTLDLDLSVIAYPQQTYSTDNCVLKKNSPLIKPSVLHPSVVLEVHAEGEDETDFTDNDALLQDSWLSLSALSLLPQTSEVSTANPLHPICHSDDPSSSWQTKIFATENIDIPQQTFQNQTVKAVSNSTISPNYLSLSGCQSSHPSREDVHMHIHHDITRNTEYHSLIGSPEMSMMSDKNHFFENNDCLSAKALRSEEKVCKADKEGGFCSKCTQTPPLRFEEDSHVSLGIVSPTQPPLQHIRVLSVTPSCLPHEFLPANLVVNSAVEETLVSCPTAQLPPSDGQSAVSHVDASSPYHRSNSARVLSRRIRSRHSLAGSQETLSVKSGINRVHPPPIRLPMEHEEFVLSPNFDPALLTNNPHTSLRTEGDTLIMQQKVFLPASECQTEYSDLLIRTHTSSSSSSSSSIQRRTEIQRGFLEHKDSLSALSDESRAEKVCRAAENASVSSKNSFEYSKQQYFHRDTQRVSTSSFSSSCNDGDQSILENEFVITEYTHQKPSSALDEDGSPFVQAVSIQMFNHDSHEQDNMLLSHSIGVPCLSCTATSSAKYRLPRIPLPPQSPFPSSPQTFVSSTKHFFSSSSFSDFQPPNTSVPCSTPSSPPITSTPTPLLSKINASRGPQMNSIKSDSKFIVSPSRPMNSATPPAALSKTASAIINGQLVDLPPPSSFPSLKSEKCYLVDLISKMLTSDPAQRIRVEELRNHIFLKEACKRLHLLSPICSAPNLQPHKVCSKRDREISQSSNTKDMCNHNHDNQYDGAYQPDLQHENRKLMPKNDDFRPLLQSRLHLITHHEEEMRKACELTGCEIASLKEQVLAGRLNMRTACFNLLVERSHREVKPLSPYVALHMKIPKNPTLHNFTTFTRENSSPTPTSSIEGAHRRGCSFSSFLANYNIPSSHKRQTSLKMGYSSEKCFSSPSQKSNLSQTSNFMNVSYSPQINAPESLASSSSSLQVPTSTNFIPTL